MLTYLLGIRVFWQAEVLDKSLTKDLQGKGRLAADIMNAEFRF